MRAERAPLSHGNAKRARQIYGLLGGRVLTSRQIAQESGITRDAAARALLRLRHMDGVEVVCLGEDEPEVGGVVATHGACLYTVLLPEGRVCADPGCSTLLCRRNPSQFCGLHGGWRVTP